MLSNTAQSAQNEVSVLQTPYHSMITIYWNGVSVLQTQLQQQQDEMDCAVSIMLGDHTTHDAEVLHAAADARCKARLCTTMKLFDDQPAKLG